MSRHLNESQRAVVASKIATLHQGRPTNPPIGGFTAMTQPKAAALLNVSTRSVQRAQPFDARSLDLGLRHLGFLIRLDYGGVCAVCTGWINKGDLAIESSATNAYAHRCCGELYKPEGVP